MDSSLSSMGDPVALMERAFIEEYLRAHGHTLETLHQLPGDEAKALLTQASLHASAKLTEVESRAHFVHEIHGDATLAGKG